MKVLIIDDSPEEREILKITLEDQGYEVIEASDGLEGFCLALKNKPDLIISDGLMPVMDGYELLRKIKEDDTLKAIPFILYTAVYTGIQEKNLATSLGAEAVICKPKSPDIFWNELTAILDKVAKKKQPSEAIRLSEDEEAYLKQYTRIVATKLEETVKALNKAKAEILETRERLQLLLSYSPAVIYSCEPSPPYSIAFITDNIIAMTGYEVQDFMANPGFWTDHIHPEDMQRIFSDLQRLNEDTHQIHEYRFLHRDGTYRWLHDELKLAMDDAGKPVEIVGYRADITERKKMENSLRLAAVQWRITFDAIANPICLLDKDGKILRCNMALSNLLGEKPGDIIGMRCRDIIQRKTGFVKEGPDCLTKDTLHREISGLLIGDEWFEVSTDPFFDNDGKLEGAVHTLVNITERKKMEQITLERIRIAEFGRDIGNALNKGGEFRKMLALCTGAMVKHLEAAFARIWTLNQDGTVLELQASSGMYTHLNGPHSSIPVNINSKIAIIARTMKPHLTNEVIGDAQVTDQEWARREGIVAFAGYPLLLKDRLLGVIVIFSKTQLSEFVFNALEVVAGNISLGIERIRAEQELHKYSRELEQKVKERTTELEEAKEAAETANKTKSDFLANMSHELRTPLNSIMGFSEVIMKGMTGPLTEKQREFINDIYESGDHLLKLINDILDLSKVEAGRSELELSEVNLPELIQSSILMFREKALKHNVRTNSEIEEGLVYVVLDELKIKQVLFNLLSNAIKFTLDGGSVHLNARKVATDLVEISVEDTGIGIREEDLPRLFQPFQQLETLLTKKHPGTGLGLSLCKKFIELHGGTIWVESEAGKGSRFIFVIPLKQKDNPSL